MQVRAGVGWQYALADLSLILFMVCAAALAREQRAHAIRPPAAVRAPAATASPVPAIALADPVAVWRPGPDMPTLAEWLASQTIDRRQRLTIVAHYSGGKAQLAFARAQDVLEAQPHLPPSTRIVVEPAAINDLSATLTWDVGGT